MKKSLFILFALLLTAYLIVSCDSETEVDDQEVIEMYDSLDPGERPADVMENAAAFKSRLIQTSQGDSLNFKLPDPVGYVQLHVRRVSQFDDDSYDIYEGSLDNPHGGFFEFSVYEDYFEGIIQTANPLAAFRITYNPNTESHQIRRILDSDYLEGGQPLIPPDL